MADVFRITEKEAEIMLEGSRYKVDAMRLLRGELTAKGFTIYPPVDERIQSQNSRLSGGTDAARQQERG